MSVRDRQRQPERRREGRRKQGREGGRGGRGRPLWAAVPLLVSLCCSLNLSIQCLVTVLFLLGTESVSVDMAVGYFGFIEGLEEDTGFCGGGRFCPLPALAGWSSLFPSGQRSPQPTQGGGTGRTPEGEPQPGGREARLSPGAAVTEETRGRRSLEKALGE